MRDEEILDEKIKEANEKWVKYTTSAETSFVTKKHSEIRKIFTRISPSSSGVFNIFNCFDCPPTEKWKDDKSLYSCFEWAKINRQGKLEFSEPPIRMYLWDCLGGYLTRKGTIKKRIEALENEVVDEVIVKDGSFLVGKVNGIVNKFVIYLLKIIEGQLIPEKILVCKQREQGSIKWNESCIASSGFNPYYIFLAMSKAFDAYVAQKLSAAAFREAEAEMVSELL